jgi:DNA-directed RNA polymerase specialized sigma24 family protein
VERERALRRLPETHEEALRLRDRGCGDEEIAESLQIPVEAVAPLLQIAETKLARLIGETF